MIISGQREDDVGIGALPRRALEAGHRAIGVAAVAGFEVEPLERLHRPFGRPIELREGAAPRRIGEIAPAWLDGDLGEAEDRGGQEARAVAKWHEGHPAST